MTALAQPMTALAIHAKGVIAFPLGEPGVARQWVIGRAKDADIVIDDPSVSRRHAILYGGAAFEIEDVGSENGTTIVHGTGVPSAAEETPRLVPHRLRWRERAVLGPSVHAQLGRVTFALQLGTAGWQAPLPSRPASLASGVVVVSPVMKRIYWLAERFAQGAINVLLLGETGVGKEVLAEHIHHASPRRDGPFFRLNCASFRGELLESELFGHERGAFTGAVMSKPGLVELADGGTLFLDEIGETPLDLQARLLRFLEDRRALRVGGTDAEVVDVRIISATNRDLASGVDDGKFRSDLYFRLNGVALEIPPLRARPEEIIPLAEHFVRVRAASLGLGAAPPIATDALALLKRLPFPGNARELRNLVDRAMLLADPGTPLLAEHFARGNDRSAPAHEQVEAEVDDDERRRIIAVLDECGGNQTRAAKQLGVTRRALIIRLERYGIARPRRRERSD